MKSFLTIFTLVSFILVLESRAQLLNPGFESWTAGMPDHWFFFEAPGLPTSPSHNQPMLIQAPMLQSLKLLIGEVECLYLQF